MAKGNTPASPWQALGGCGCLIVLIGVCGASGWGIWTAWPNQGRKPNPSADQSEPNNLTLPLPPKLKGDLSKSEAPPLPGQPLDFTGLRGVLSGKWQGKEDGSEKPPIMEFTGKSIEFKELGFVDDVGKYEMKDDLLQITDRNGVVNIYGLEFLSDGEIALRPEKLKNGTDFNDLQGRWQRISLPTGRDPAPLGKGPLADAKRQVQQVEQKESKLETLLETANADRDELVAKLRAVGVESTADLKGNFRGQRLAENVAKIAAEIDGLERQLASIDSELLKAKALVRRMEREEAGVSEDDMRRLAEQLKEVEERTDGMAPTPTTPLDVDSAVEKALKAPPRPATPKKKT